MLGHMHVHVINCTFFCHTAPPNFTLSLSGTVLTASWDALTVQDISYTLTCRVGGNEVLSLNTPLTEVVVGIYMHD